jgi:hypothetical protein
MHLRGRHLNVNYDCGDAETNYSCGDAETQDPSENGWTVALWETLARVEIKPSRQNLKLIRYAGPLYRSSN